MKLKFDANQDFQIQAVNSVVGLFEGQEKIESHIQDRSSLLGVYANILSLSREEVIKNGKKIKKYNNVINGDETTDLDFSVEMETGTGKTYVYLRTILELNQKYSWKKFIILVPSVAIREGVIKTLNITKEHFKKLYNNIPYRYYEYQSKNISSVRHFASSSNIEIMIMTIGAFNKDTNVLYSARDQMQGEQPITYLQKTNPILIMDEPQNMEGEATKKALKNFNSLFRLRYSATHKNTYNLIYQLAPYDAYQMGLVKKVEVLSVTDDETGNSKPFMNLIDVKPGKTFDQIKASLEVMVKNNKGELKKKTIILKRNDDLLMKTNNSAYDGYIVDNLTAHAPEFQAVGQIRFRNNVKIEKDEEINSSREELIQEQIKQTIRLHFQKKQNLKELGVKPLALFFIDKVDNYVKDDGLIKKTFIEQFEIIKKEFGFDKLDVTKTHKGYFAMKKNNEYLERDKAIAENKEAFELIMRDKERLLSFDEPTEFIFSHSALKEGWDNPNVFNICTLNTTTSTMKKRQEIGRGMRLCVNQEGERIFLKNVNRLSVIANESYFDYVSQLQAEFVEDGIYKVPPIPNNAKKKITVKLKKDFAKDENFQSIWKKISKKTKYSVNIDTDQLVKRASDKIKSINILKPQIRIDRVGINIGKQHVEAGIIGGESQKLSQEKRSVDCVEQIKDETKLTRQTVIEILIQSNNFSSLFNNPEKFVYEAVKIIKEELVKDYIEQINYEIIDEEYNINQFENIPSYRDNIQKIDRSIYDAIVCDSEVERKFAVDLEKDERIKLFIKLPSWFNVNTPVGKYNPDWAIVTTKIDLQGRDLKEKVYFVIETKGGSDLRHAEQAKIKSAKKHFSLIEVNYKEINKGYEQFKEECMR